MAIQVIQTAALWKKPDSPVREQCTFKESLNSSEKYIEYEWILHDDKDKTFPVLQLGRWWQLLCCQCFGGYLAPEELCPFSATGKQYLVLNTTHFWEQPWALHSWLQEHPECPMAAATACCAACSVCLPWFLQEHRKPRQDALSTKCTLGCKQLHSEQTLNAQQKKKW